jgi:addiction module RelB/DinJ family antitoxin
MDMKDAVIRARIDESLKNEAERVLGRMGLSTTEAIRMFLTQVSLHKGIPFPIAVPGSPLDVDDIVHPVEKRNAALDLIDED